MRALRGRPLTPACAGNTLPSPETRGRYSAHPLRGEHSDTRYCPAAVSRSPPPGGEHYGQVSAKNRVERSPPPARGTPAPQSQQASPSVHPRLRGTPLRRPIAGIPHPLTPACAGNTAARKSPIQRTTAHPRLRGEHLFGLKTVQTVDRSPPRGEHASIARNTGSVRRSPPCAGNTSWLDDERLPASAHPRAGNTAAPAPPDTGRPAHPRLRGEHSLRVVSQELGHRSPPPARGTLEVAAMGCRCRPLTPACAGNTLAGSR